LKKILVLGAGLRRFPGAIHLDINSATNPDIVHDLMKYPWPFEDNRFKSIIAEHILEHIWTHGDVEGFFKLFREIWRICQNGARIICEMPYAGHTIAFDDPGHRSFWTPTLFYFVSKKCYQKAKEKNSKMTQYGINFDFDLESATLIAEKQGQTPMILKVVLRAVK